MTKLDEDDIQGVYTSTNFPPDNEGAVFRFTKYDDIYYYSSETGFKSVPWLNHVELGSSCHSEPGSKCYYEPCRRLPFKMLRQKDCNIPCHSYVGTKAVA